MEVEAELLDEGTISGTGTTAGEEEGAGELGLSEDGLRERRRDPLRFDWGEGCCCLSIGGRRRQ